MIKAMCTCVFMCTHTHLFRGTMAGRGSCTHLTIHSRVRARISVSALGVPVLSVPISELVFQH